MMVMSSSPFFFFSIGCIQRKINRQTLLIPKRRPKARLPRTMKPSITALLLLSGSGVVVPTAETEKKTEGVGIKMVVEVQAKVIGTELLEMTEGINHLYHHSN